MEVTNVRTEDDLLASQATNNTDVSGGTTENSATPETPVVQDEFASFMRSALGISGTGQVNEEELFAALIAQRLGAESEEARSFYEAKKAELMTSMARADGYVPVEDVAKRALSETVAAGKVDEATAERVSAEAFRAAQLDDNLDALYDGRGSGDDPTIAVAQMEGALLTMRSVLDKIDAGELDVGSRPLDAPSNGVPGGSAGGVESSGALGTGSLTGSQGLDGSGGFLWKPVSESDGNLVVLLPTDLKGFIDRVEIHSSLPPDEESKVEKGRFAGDTHNGGRSHFRFEKPGEAYGDNVHLVVFKDNGETVTWDIANGGQRYD